MYKVIIDSNIWVSFLIGKSFRNLVEYIRGERIKIITCDEQLRELAGTFQKRKLQKFFQPYQTTIFLEFLKGVSLKVPITRIVPVCRDPKDDYLLALSIASKADYLVTGDADLLTLQFHNRTKIVTYNEFVALAVH